MEGLEDVPLYIAKPPRPTCQQASRPASRQAAGASAKPSKDEEACDATPEPDLILEAFDVDDPEAAAAAPAPPPAKVRVVKLRREFDKPFSNFQRYAAARRSLAHQSVHVTSVGPYVSKLEQRAIDEQKESAKSIHAAAFFPAGPLKHSAKDGAGFAAGGFVLPDDLPATALKFGSFYNAHAHNFRATAPKKNLYM